MLIEVLLASFFYPLGLLSHKLLYLFISFLDLVFQYCLDIRLVIRGFNLYRLYVQSLTRGVRHLGLDDNLWALFLGGRLLLSHLFDCEADHTAADLDCFGHIGLQVNLLLLGKYESTKLRQIVFHEKSTLLICLFIGRRVFHESMTSRN